MRSVNNALPTTRQGDGLKTLFANETDQVGHAYPRPQLQRGEWISLNGQWDVCFRSASETAPLLSPAEVLWAGASIMVPFSPESEASGIGDPGFHPETWYRRTVDLPVVEEGSRVLLHFGAVDWQANVWVNGAPVAQHEGGYTPFSTDITEVLRGRIGPQEIIVQALDDPSDLCKPRGKQDWRLQPHSIWYPRTSGIWQTVWIEVVPATYIQTVRWDANLVHWEIALEVHLAGAPREDLSLEVRMHAGEQVLSDDVYSIVKGEVHRRIALSDPGIDDSRNDLLWSPSSPTIIDVEMTLRTRAGEVIERVLSYTALRAIAIEGDRFILNARPMQLRLVLDQGYWPEGGLTAPNDDAYLQDVLLAKRMGFNGVRKHQKIENPRYLYWADRMGLLVWEEMPSAYRYTRKSIERVTREWIDVLNRDCSHPCIIAWVPFNESWGVPDLPNRSEQRAYVQALYHLTKTFDLTRPVIGNDGWESVATDIIGIHDYEESPERLNIRYEQSQVEARLFKHERPGGRMLMIDNPNMSCQPVMLSEFGGIALSRRSPEQPEDWGYSRSESSEELLRRYGALLQVVRNLSSLAGFCYTQFADTYQEANGLLYANRTPKAPVEEIALATKGSRPEFNRQEEAAWRERLMERQRP